MRRWSRCTSPRASRGAGRRPGSRRASTAPGREAARRDVRDLRAAAERDRRAAHGPRAQRLDPGRPDPLAPDARLRHALAARLRPRGDRDPERGREAARRRGDVAQGARPRGVRGAGLAAPGGDGPRDHGPVPLARRLARLLARAVHDGRRLHRGRDALLRPRLGARLDLSGQPDRQLVPVPRDGDLRPRGRARRHGRHAHLRPLPVRGRLGARDDRDRAAGDDPRRRRGGRPPRRRALRGRDRQGGARPLRRAAGARDRGRARRARVRHRRAQDHARPRPDRLRDRPRRAGSRP